MFSYWEQQSFTDYHYAVVGGGLVGLSTAISLKEMHPNASVVVLERGIIPKGASTRNAGFACFGSIAELLSDFDDIGTEAAVELVADRWNGLKLLQKRVGIRNLRYQNHGGYELLFRDDLEYLQKLDQVNESLMPVFEQPVFSVRNNLIKQFGFNQKRVVALIANPLEGQVHTGEMMKSLISLAKAQGIEYLTGASVKNFETGASGIDLNVCSVGPETIRFSVKRLAICTNAFTDLLPDLNIQPGRGMVLITNKLPQLKFKGTFHYKQGYYYFRDVDSRVLFGGGRNLDVQGEATTNFRLNQKILEHLKRELNELILPGQKFEVEGQWSGIMAFGRDKRPSVGLYNTEVGYAVGLGGMGVALGSLVGNRLARLICLKPENV